MAAENKEVNAAAAKKAETVTAAHSAPVVIEKKKKKKKRRYTRGMRTMQEFEMGTTRATQRLGKAISKGLSVYRRRRNKSSRKRRDGSIRDVVENVGKAVSRGMRSGSNAPYQFAKAVNSRRFSKQVRDALRMVAPPLFR
jgi:hypothetical protein